MHHHTMRELLTSEVTIDGIFLLPTPVPPQGLIDILDDLKELPEELQGFTRDWPASQVKALLGGDLNAWERLSRNMVADGWMRFWFQVRTPATQGEGRHTSRSWDETHSHTIIATSLAKGLDAAVAWAVELSEQTDTD